MAFKFGNIQVFPHHYFFDFMKWRKFTVGFSALLVLASFVIMGVKGLNYSIDFLGGAEIEISFLKEGMTRENLVSAIQKLGISHVEVTQAQHALGTRQNLFPSYVIRIQREKGQDENATTSRADLLVSSLKKQWGENFFQVASITNISGKIGREDELKGYLALLLACIGILIYIAFRFDARFAPGAVLCLLHNVFIALAFMTLLGRPFTTTSLAAFLTIVGYSINDTVIVYDRIRETRLLQPKMSLVDVVNKSISQTMNRTVLTSSTGILALLVLVILGGGSVENFAMTMLVGVIVGTYSSIYVAAPLTLMMDHLYQKWGWTSQLSTEKVGGQKSVREKAHDAPPIHLRKKSIQEKK